jgi:hypothetical protein
MSFIWKYAQIIFIHKPGRPLKIPSSYQTISLLLVVDELFEKLLLNRISNVSADNNIIIDLQFGFKTKHSTIHQFA